MVLVSEMSLNEFIRKNYNSAEIKLVKKDMIGFLGLFATSILMIERWYNSAVLTKLIISVSHLNEYNRIFLL